MTNKITAVMVAAILTASAGAASAQTNAHVARVNAQVARTNVAQQNPYSYYNRDYWDAVSPGGRIQQRDPFVGTYFEGVVPY